MTRPAHRGRRLGSAGPGVFGAVPVVCGLVWLFFPSSFFFVRAAILAMGNSPTAQVEELSLHPSERAIVETR